MSKTVFLGDFVEFIYCGCGCNFTKPKYNKTNPSRPTKFIKGHHGRGKHHLTLEMRRKISIRNSGINSYWFGKHHSEETKLKMSESQKADKHHNWKGDNAGYASIHIWVRKNKKIPDFCENCNLVPPLDLANITGIYNRDFKNWKYLCRKCHQISDGRYEKLKKGLSLIQT